MIKICSYAREKRFVPNSVLIPLISWILQKNHCFLTVLFLAHFHACISWPPAVVQLKTTAAISLPTTVHCVWPHMVFQTILQTFSGSLTQQMTSVYPLGFPQFHIYLQVLLIFFLFLPPIVCSPTTNDIQSQLPTLQNLSSTMSLRPLSGQGVSMPVNNFLISAAGSSMNRANSNGRAVTRISIMWANWPMTFRNMGQL